MIEPIDFRILIAVRDRLRTIMKPDYYFTVQSAAVRLNPNLDAEELQRPGGPNPFILIEPLPDRFAWVEKSDQVEHVFPLRVHFITDVEATSGDEATLLGFTRACADLEVAMSGINQGGDRSWGQLAYDTSLARRAMTVVGTRVIAQMDFPISIRRTFGHPKDLS